MASPPLYMTPVTAEDMARGDGELVIKFAETFCRITKDGIAGRGGDLLRFRPWQKTLTNALYARRADGRRKHRRALIGMPRKNAKSGITSAFALHGLVTGPQGSEVYGLASDKDQAKIVFSMAKSMVEMDPELSGMIKVYRDVLELPATGSIYKALSSEAYSKEGYNPTLVVYDELHAAPNDELFNVFINAFGYRLDPLMICITTAGVKTDSTGGDSICYRQYQLGKQIVNGEVDDPTFFFVWWGAQENTDPSAPETWAAANPGYEDFVAAEDFRAVYSTHIADGTVNDFKTKRLNMWVSATRAWLPEGAWSRCHRSFTFTPPPKGIVLGFDGSRNGDSTALVAVTVEPDPKIIVLGCWEKPPDKSVEWRVPREEVKEAIREACRTYNVREVAADEYIWVGELEELAEEGIPVVAFPQTTTRMGPATQRFYELVSNQRISHDGHQALARHLSNAQIRTDQRGSRLAKDAKNSPRKIDLAVAAVMAVDRAGYWLTQDGPDTFMGVPVKSIHFVWSIAWVVFIAGLSLKISHSNHMASSVAVGAVRFYPSMSSLNARQREVRTKLARFCRTASRVRRRFVKRSKEILASAIRYLHANA